jgi:hypothetical protein
VLRLVGLGDVKGASSCLNTGSILTLLLPLEQSFEKPDIADLLSRWSCGWILFSGLKNIEVLLTLVRNDTVQRFGELPPSLNEICAQRAIPPVTLAY